MLTTLNSQLRRHRRKAKWALAVLAVAAVAHIAHSALMSSDMGDHSTSNAVAICLTVGGCVAVIGVAAFAVRRVLQRPTWTIPAPFPPALAHVPAAAGFLGRAGPPPSLLQVFRL
jgi:hypothetical protein